MTAQSDRATSDLQCADVPVSFASCQASSDLPPPALASHKDTGCTPDGPVDPSGDGAVILRETSPAVLAERLATRVAAARKAAETRARMRQAQIRPEQLERVERHARDRIGDAQPGAARGNFTIADIISSISDRTKGASSCR